MTAAAKKPKRTAPPPAQPLILLCDMPAIYGPSLTTIKKLRNSDPDFPKPMKFGVGRGGWWRRAETDAYFGVKTAAPAPLSAPPSTTPASQPVAAGPAA